VPVAVDLDESLPGLVVIGKCSIWVSRDTQHGREIHQNGVEEDVGSAGVSAEIICLTGQFLGAGEIPDRSPIVDQVGGGLQRVHVVHA
jgi:hypothetical protein